jgi:hypothetical protein
VFILVFRLDELIFGEETRGIIANLSMFSHADDVLAGPNFKTRRIVFDEAFATTILSGLTR